MDSGRLLERLVARYSPSGREAGAVRAFVGAARALGYRVRIDAAGNGVAVRGRGRPELLYLGHLDTVEGERPVRWRGDRLHGRGTVDAKGGLAAALIAGHRWAGPGTLRIVGSVGEETDSRGARHLLRGRRADGVIAGEPSGWDGVTVGYRGIVRAVAEFRRPRRHYSSPAPTAADLAVDWVAAVRAAVAARAGGSPFRSPSVKVIAWRSSPPGDDERAELTIDARLPPGLSTRAFDDLLPTRPAPDTLRRTARIEPFEGSRADPVAAAVLDGIRAEGARPTVWRKGGTSDLNLVAAGWGIPGAAYGPGDARLDHTDRESLGRDELDRSVRVLERAFATLLGGCGRPPTLPRSAAGA